MIGMAIVCVLPLVPAPRGGEAPVGGEELSVASLAQDAAEDQESPWSGSVTAGLIFTDGDIDSLTAALTADAVREGENDRITLGIFHSYEENDTSGATKISQRRTGAKGKYDYFLSERTYALGQASVEDDLASMLDIRYTVGGGIGRKLVDDDRFKFDAEAGLTYFVEDYTGTSRDEFTSARGAYTLEYVPNDKVTLGQTLEVFPSIEDGDDVYAKLDSRTKVLLTEAMFLQLQYVMDWDNTPPSGVSNYQHRVTMTVGWSF